MSVEPRASGAGAALPERDDELAEVDLVGAVLVEDGEDALRELGPVEVEVVEHLPELEAPAAVLVDLQELRVQPRDVGLVEPQALEGVAELVDAVVVVDARAEGPLQSQADVPGQQVQERVEQPPHAPRAAGRGCETERCAALDAGVAQWGSTAARTDDGMLFIVPSQLSGIKKPRLLNSLNPC